VQAKHDLLPDVRLLSCGQTFGFPLCGIHQLAATITDHRSIFTA